MSYLTEKEIFQRTELLIGSDALARLRQLRVIIFGVGGVGSWCAESLVRSGIGSLTINPSAEINPLQRRFNAETADSFDLAGYDYIIDAIDSLKDKMLLIEMACDTKAQFFSSMGAARKMDPTHIQVDEFRKVHGDPLARTLRKRFNQQGRLPSRKFQCVFSDELLPNRGAPTDTVNGTLAHITAIFGFTLAGQVIKDAVARCSQKT